MFSHEKGLTSLVGAFYESAVSPEHWKQFLRLAARQADCDNAILTLHDDRLSDWTLQESSGLPPEALQKYNARYGALNPAIGPLFREVRRTGSWHGLSRALVGEREYKRSEYYNEYGRYYGSYWGVMGTVFRRPHVMITLSIIRSERRPALGAEAVELMGLLMPHLASVVRIRRMVDSLRSVSAAAATAVRASEATLVAVDAKGKVLMKSPRAEEILREGDGLRLHQRRLLAGYQDEARRLEELVQSAAATGAGRGVLPGGSMLIHRRSRRALQITVSPFRSSHSFSDTFPCALVFIGDPDRRPATRAAVLADLYQLTPAECRFADLLLTGQDLAAIARNLRITRGTARFMLKSIFRKTGTHRQAELMRFLLGLPYVAAEH